MAVQYAPLFALETQFQAKNGRNLTGGFLRVFLAATDDPADTYSDYNGTRNPDNIVLDDDGRAVVICDKSKAYRLEVYDADGMLMWTEEPVFCSGSGGAGMSSSTDIISTDGTIVVEKSTSGSSTTFDIGLGIDMDRLNPSCLSADATPRNSDGKFVFGELSKEGDLLSVDNYGCVRCEPAWYHFTAIVELAYDGTATNAEQQITLYTTLSNSVVDFDLSYAHRESIELSGDIHVVESNSEFVLGVTGLPNGVVASLVDFDIHAITGHEQSTEYTAGNGIDIADHVISADLDVVQEKLVAGQGVTIEGNVISAPSLVQVNSDWNATSGVAEILNKPNLDVFATKTEVNTGLAGKQNTINDLSTIRSGASAGASAVQPSDLAPVATSGDYDDLSDKPDLSVYATTQAMNTALAGKQDTISDLSTIRSGAQAGATAVQPSDLATVATTGDYDDLSDKPDLSIYAESSDLATVATTGSYDDLSDKPSIPAAQVNSDWNASSGVAAILNKPSLATVATTGDYDDLSNKPSIPAAQVNSDWSETDSTSKAYIENKPDLSVYAQSSDLATVATTGDYDDLQNKPVIPAAQIQSDWTESDSTSKAYIQHKPDLSIYAQSANLATVATTGDYTDLDNTPSLATVATTGDYSDLTNKPSIPAAQVNSDWDAQSGVAQILNKPNLATVATSGNYNDLSNKPTIPPAVTVDQHYDALSENPQSGTAVAEAIAGTGQVPTVGSSDDNKVLMASFSGGVGSYSWEPSAAATQVNADWDANSGVAKILNKPDLSVYAESSDLAAVATSGDYNDLQNRPSIPAAQVNADWDANSGVAQILNKPNLATVATSGDYSDLSNKPVIPAAQVQSNWNESDSTSKAYIQNKPDLSVYAQSANLATVATSGDYADLSNKPTIPAAQVQSNWNESDNTSKAYIQNKPDLSVYAQSSSLAAVATSGDYDDLENKPVIPAAQIQADWNETNTSSKAYIQNKPTIPAAVTVDQTYDASSTNPQSGTAVAEAVASISVDEVPAVTSSDDGKVLKATYSGGTGSYSWETETGATYTAGDAIDITNNEISVDYDTNTLSTVYGTSSVNMNMPYGRGYFRLPEVIQDLAASANPSTVTVHLPANTLYILGHFGPRDLPYRTIPLRIMLGASDYRPVDEDGEFSQLETVDVACTYDSENDYTWVDGQDITISLPCDSQNGWSHDIVATKFTIGADVNYADPYSDILKISTGMPISNPIVFSYQDASAPQKLAVRNPLPASTSADADKVLKVDANGVPEWSTGGGTQVQSDWTEADNTEPSYIQNKPVPKTLTAGTGISITENQSTITIANTAPDVPIGSWEDVSTEAQYNTTPILAGGFEIKYNSMLKLVSVTADVNIAAGAANIFTWSNRLKPVANAFALGNGLTLYVSQTSLNQPASATNRWVNGVWMWPVVGE